jgi:hypothetical protein
LLRPTDATNEGSRLLRVLLVRQSFGAIAKRVGCDESAIRHYAHERRKPDRMLRARMHERLGIRDDAWDERPSADLYATSEPETARAAPPLPPTTRRPSSSS